MVPAFCGTRRQAQARRRCQRASLCSVDSRLPTTASCAAPRGASRGSPRRPLASRPRPPPLLRASRFVRLRQRSRRGPRGTPERKAGCPAPSAGPEQLASRLVEGAAVVTRRVVAQPGGLVGRRLALLLGQLPLALGFPGLARQGFLDGLENLLQLGLFALALLLAAGAVATGALQAGQY